MFVKQLSVFLENTEGRLDEVLKILAQGGIDLLSASLADTTEFGVLRLLAKDPDKAKQILKDAGFAARIDEVIAVVVPDAVGSLAKVVAMIHAAGINISYIYGLSVPCHEGDSDVLTKGEITMIHRRTISDDFTFLNFLSNFDDGLLVNAGTLVTSFKFL